MSFGGYRRQERQYEEQYDPRYQPGDDPRYAQDSPGAALGRNVLVRLLPVGIALLIGHARQVPQPVLIHGAPPPCWGPL